jgi:hypothetical protein
MVLLFAPYDLATQAPNSGLSLRTCGRRRLRRSRLWFDHISNRGIALQPALVHPGQRFSASPECDEEAGHLFFLVELEEEA